MLDFEKRAPIHVALEEDKQEVVAMLLEKGADPNVPSQDFVSCVHYLSTRCLHACMLSFLFPSDNLGPASASTSVLVVPFVLASLFPYLVPCPLNLAKNV